MLLSSFKGMPAVIILENWNLQASQIRADFSVQGENNEELDCKPDWTLLLRLPQILENDYLRMQFGNFLLLPDIPFLQV